MTWHALLAEPAIEAALSWLVQRRNSESGAERWLGRAAIVFGLFAAAGVVFAYWLWLTRRFPAEDALVLFSLGMAVACCLCLGLVVMIRGYRSHREEIWRRRVLATARETSLAVAESLETAASEFPKTMTALALVAGVILSGKALAGTEKAMAALEETLNRPNSGGVH